MYDSSMDVLIKTPDTTRQKLLQAAFTEIYRHGYQAASLTQILSDTALTKGALYHYFPDKKALGLAVVEEIVRPLIAEMMFNPIAETRQPLLTMQQLLIAKAAEDDPLVVALGCPLNNLMQEMSPVDETFRIHLNNIFQDWVAVVQKALTRGKESGEVRRDVDAAETAFFIVSALEGCVGMSKNTQSVTAFRGCLAQLGRFLDTLKR